MVTFEILRIARIDNADLLHHLTNDHTSMCLSLISRPASVDFLDLVHQVFLHCGRTLDAKNVMRIDRAC